jgi:hypothetical protein
VRYRYSGDERYWIPIKVYGIHKKRVLNTQPVLVAIEMYATINHLPILRPAIGRVQGSDRGVRTFVNNKMEGTSVKGK